MNLVIQLVEILTLVLLPAGCVLLHVRLRRPSSLSLLLSIAAVIAWGFWGETALSRALPYPPCTGACVGTAQGLIGIGRWDPLINLLGAALWLWLGSSFFLAINAVRPASGGRPNKSFKPKPLRGSA